MSTTVKTATNRYRVIEVAIYGPRRHGRPTHESRILWEGDDLVELTEMYPPQGFSEGDDLNPFEIPELDMRCFCRFQRQQGDGSWKDVKDPRYPKGGAYIDESWGALGVEYRERLPRCLLCENAHRDPLMVDGDLCEGCSPRYDYD